MQRQPSEVFYKKDFRKYFTKFTGKHLYQNLFLNKVAGPKPLNSEEIAFKHFLFTNIAKFR